MSPIVGIRYKCSVRANYDLCEKCEERLQPLKYAMVKIRDPKIVPVQMICQYPDAPNNQEPAPKKDEKPQEAQVFLAKSSVRAILRSKCDQHPATQQLKKVAGETFSLQWSFINSGDTAWPSDVKFIQVNGDVLTTSTDIVASPVQPQSPLKFNQTITCPEKPGLYSGFFRLAHGPDSIEFGEKVYVDLLVEEPPKKEPEVDNKKMLLLRSQQMVDKFEQNEGLNQSFEIDSVKSKSDEEVDEDKDKAEIEESSLKEGAQKLATEMGTLSFLDKQEEKKIDDVKVSALNESEMLKIEYVQKLDSASYGPQYKQNLLNLMNMGFYNFNDNLELLQKNFNNLEIACTKLFENNN